MIKPWTPLWVWIRLIESSTSICWGETVADVEDIFVAAGADRQLTQMLDRRMETMATWRLYITAEVHAEQRWRERVHQSEIIRFKTSSETETNNRTEYRTTTFFLETGDGHYRVDLWSRVTGLHHLDLFLSSSVTERCLIAPLFCRCSCSIEDDEMDTAVIVLCCFSLSVSKRNRSSHASLGTNSVVGWKYTSPHILNRMWSVAPPVCSRSCRGYLLAYHWLARLAAWCSTLIASNEMQSTSKRKKERRRKSSE